MQPLSSQWSLQPVLQTLQEGSKLRRSKYQTQIPFKEENIDKEQEYSTNILQNSLWKSRKGFTTIILLITYIKMLVRNYEEFIRIQWFSDNLLSRIVRINKVD